MAARIGGAGQIDLVRHRRDDDLPPAPLQFSRWCSPMALVAHRTVRLQVAAFMESAECLLDEGGIGVAGQVAGHGQAHCGLELLQGIPRAVAEHAVDFSGGIAEQEQTRLGRAQFDIRRRSRGEAPVLDAQLHRRIGLTQMRVRCRCARISPNRGHAWRGPACWQ